MKNERNKLVLIITIIIAIVSITIINNIDWTRLQTIEKKIVTLENQSKENNSTDLLLELGLSYSLKGEADKAIETYRLVLEQDPDSILAWHRLSLLYIEDRRFEEALAAREKVLKLDSNDPTSYYYYASILLLYDVEEALDIGKRYVELSKNSEYAEERTIKNYQMMINTFEKHYKSGDLFSAYVSLITAETYIEQQIEIEMINIILENDNLSESEESKLKDLKSHIEEMIQKGILE